MIRKLLKEDFEKFKKQANDLITPSNKEINIKVIGHIIKKYVKKNDKYKTSIIINKEWLKIVNAFDTCLFEAGVHRNIIQMIQFLWLSDSQEVLNYLFKTADKQKPSLKYNQRDSVKAFILFTLLQYNTEIDSRFIVFLNSFRKSPLMGTQPSEIDKVAAFYAKEPFETNDKKIIEFFKVQFQDKTPSPELKELIDNQNEFNKNYILKRSYIIKIVDNNEQL